MLRNTLELEVANQRRLSGRQRLADVAACCSQSAPANFMAPYGGSAQPIKSAELTKPSCLSCSRRINMKLCNYCPLKKQAKENALNCKLRAMPKGKTNTSKRGSESSGYVTGSVSTTRTGSSSTRAGSTSTQAANVLPTIADETMNSTPPSIRSDNVFCAPGEVEEPVTVVPADQVAPEVDLPASPIDVDELVGPPDELEEFSFLQYCKLFLLELK